MSIYKFINVASLLLVLVWIWYYNKEYREGLPRGFFLTAAMDCHQTQRVRAQSTTEVSDNPRGKSRRYFFILSAVPDPV